MMHRNPQQQPFHPEAPQIDLRGLYKAAVLKVLYDFARIHDPVWMESREQPVFTVEDARNQLLYGSVPYRVEYLNGRAIFCDLRGPLLDPSSYDAHNGRGRAELAIATLSVFTWRRMDPFATDEPVQ
jgi:hypothetical protein